MIDQTNASLQEVLSQASSMEAVKLLPWCISTVVPLCYISEAATMATHQDENISIASEPCPTVPEAEPYGSLVPGPSGVLTSPPVMSPFPVFSISNIPRDGTPLLGCSFAGLTIPPKGKQDHTPSDSPNHPHIKRTLQKSRLGVNIVPHRAMTICLTQHQRPGMTPDNHNESPPSLPPFPPEGWLTPMMMW